jgi:hypothetical protein
MISPDEQRTALTQPVHAESPHHSTAGGAAVSAGRLTGRVTVADLIGQLRLFPPHLQVWVADPGSVEGYLPLDGSVYRGSDDAPAAADPAEFLVLGTAR